jgi:hypothetical protein
MSTKKKDEKKFKCIKKDENLFFCDAKQKSKQNCDKEIAPLGE